MSAKVFFSPASVNDPPKVLAKKSEKVFFNLELLELVERSDFVALKIHFGEKGNTGYIKPLWLLPIIQSFKQKTTRVFLTDTNTLYTGNRSNAVDHLQLAWGHGFNQAALGIPILIADGIIGREDEKIPLGQTHIETAKVASAFRHSDMLLSLSHFTGHILTGFGATIKNLGMGCASRAGKLEQHSQVNPWVNPRNCVLCRTCFEFCPTGAIEEKQEKAFISEGKCIGCGECLVVCPQGAIKHDWDNNQARIQEKMTEYALSIKRMFGKKIGYMNYMLKITGDCDCMSKDAPAIIEDIGILGSLDPVALDQASVDLLNNSAGQDILKRLNNIDWSLQLKYGERIGLGETAYDLITV